MNSPGSDKATSHYIHQISQRKGSCARSVQQGCRRCHAEREAAACAGSESLDARGLGERRPHNVRGSGASVPDAQEDAHGAHVLDVRPVVETH